MKKAIVILASIPALFLAGIYALSEYQLRQNSPPDLKDLPVTNSPAIIQQGQNIARTRGCFGCHGQQLEGKVFDHWPWVKRAVAPNLVQYAKQNSSAIIDRAIRHGINSKGQAMWSMPTYNFVRLSDDDVAALISYFRHAPVVHMPLPIPAMGMMARWQYVTGAEKDMVAFAVDVPELKHQDEPTSQLARGEYIAMTTCIECHGMDLRGEVYPDSSIPDLGVIIKAYSKPAFERLMREGVGLGERSDLGLMTVVAKDRFAHFKQQDMDDLFIFLNQLFE